MTFLNDFHVISLCSNSTSTNAARAMRPILPGLAVTCWSVFHRCVSSAKPRSPRHLTERISPFRARVSMSSSLPKAASSPGRGRRDQLLRTWDRPAPALHRRTAAARPRRSPGPRPGHAHCPAARPKPTARSRTDRTAPGCSRRNHGSSPSTTSRSSIPCDSWFSPGTAGSAPQRSTLLSECLSGPPLRCVCPTSPCWERQ